MTSQQHALTIPDDYTSSLSLRETELGIKEIKDFFQRCLAERLGLTRVSAPLFVESRSGINDTLNGVERPVQFAARELGSPLEIVQSLAKWKRMALAQYGFSAGEGLYTDMNAIRRDEVLDNLHSIYVDQWDWELVIRPTDRTDRFLRQVASQIFSVLRQAESHVCRLFPALKPQLPPRMKFITAQELADRYPSLSPKEREDAITRQFGAVFLTQIGGNLQSGERHDGRAPDYDDWQLNGDILLWYPLLQQTFELSSMGIRVNRQSLLRQLQWAGCEQRQQLPYHRQLLEGQLPCTIGGGIGQSRICMFLLQKAHIGEVQVSVWPEAMRHQCDEAKINLL